MIPFKETVIEVLGQNHESSRPGYNYSSAELQKSLNAQPQQVFYARPGPGVEVIIKPRDFKVGTCVGAFENLEVLLNPLSRSNPFS